MYTINIIRGSRAVGRVDPDPSMGKSIFLNLHGKITENVKYA